MGAKKLAATKEPLKAEPAKPVPAVKPVEVAKPEPPPTFSFFATHADATRVADDVDKELEILTEGAANNDETRVCFETCSLGCEGDFQ